MQERLASMDRDVTASRAASLDMETRSSAQRATAADLLHRLGAEGDIPAEYVDAMMHTLLRFFSRVEVTLCITGCLID